jgi:hypothetical protein
MICAQHWWVTREEIGYGYVSVCDNCGKRESAEHSESCQGWNAPQDELEMFCNCGAAEEFRQYEKEKIDNPSAAL